MNYIVHILIIINIYVILTISANLVIGMVRMLSLGQAALYGIGAYLSVFALMTLKLPLEAVAIFVMLGTSIASLLVAYPSLRLRGDYFVLATLGFQSIVFAILYNWIPVTKGPYGISGIPAPKLFGILQISGNVSFLLFSSVAAIVTIGFFYHLIHSPFGRVLKGIRDDELAVMSLGRNVTAFKIWAFILSSAFTGLAGMIFATYISYIDPTSFGLDESIFILAAVLIGGVGNLRGPAIGAVFVVLLPETLRFVGLPDYAAANLRQIIYGLALILLMRYRPQGLAGDYQIQ